MRRVAIVLSLAACSRAAVAPPQPSISDAAVAYFEPNAAACDFRRADGAHEETILQVPAGCSDVSIAWNADGSRALIAKTSPRRFAAARPTPLPTGGPIPTLAGVKRQVLGAPPAVDKLWLWSSSGVASIARIDWGHVEHFGFDDTGAPAIVVLTTGGSAWAKVTALNDDPESAERRMRLVDGRWDRVEGEARPLTYLLPRLGEFMGEPTRDGALIDLLDAIAPPPARTGSANTIVMEPGDDAADIARKFESARKEHGTLRVKQWRADKDPSWFVLTTDSGTTLAHRGSDVVFVRNGKAFLPPDAPTPITSAVGRGETLLLSDGGAHPRVYDLRNGTLLWKSDTAVNTTFWPKPAGK